MFWLFLGHFVFDQQLFWGFFLNGWFSFEQEDSDAANDEPSYTHVGDHTWDIQSDFISIQFNTVISLIFQIINPSFDIQWINKEGGNEAKDEGADSKSTNNHSANHSFLFREEIPTDFERNSISDSVAETISDSKYHSKLEESFG